MRRRSLVLLILGVVLGWSGASWAASDPSLIGYWRLDDGSGLVAVDSSGHGNDGTLGGNASWVPGLFGRGLYFGGSDDHLQIPGILTETCTVAFWFKPDWDGSDPEDYRLFDASAGAIYFFIGKGANHTDITPEDFGFYFEDASDADFQTIEVPAAGTIFADTWFHVAVTWEFGGGDAILYLNGEEVARSGGPLGGFPDLAPNPRFGYETVTYIPITNGGMGVIDDIKIYDRVLDATEIPSVMEGSAVELAAGPSPANEATDVPRETGLGWTPGEYAASHDVYFGTTFTDVNDASRTNPLGVLLSEDQDANMCDLPSRLEFGQTYYWRIDEVNAPPSPAIFKGEVWSFTVEPALYPIENISATASVPTSAGASGPEATVDGSGLDGEGHHSIDETAMWLADITPGEPVYIQYDFDRLYKVYEMHIWNYNGLYEGFLGFGLKDITIEYAVEPNEWTTLGDFELARATSRATYAGENIEVGGLAMRSVRITASSNLGVQLKYGLSEVQFLHKPTFAREPQPADGATDVYRATALGWRPGREAASHQVYFDTDEDAVAGGTAPSQTVMVNTYSPGALNLGTAYFWRVDEVNDAEAPTTWDSGVWSFITQEYISIDDFESYTDEQGSQIFETWMDGYEIGDNGSLVGHENPPFAEKTVVNGGLQSMPLYYNNIGGVANSEAKLVFASPQNWTTNGADTLSLYFRGDPVEFIETSPGNIIMSGTGADIYQLTDEFRYAYKQLTGNGSITARVDTIQYTNEWAKAGVMMRATLESGTMQAHMIAAPSNRVEWMPRLTAGSDATGTATAVDSTPLPQWVRVTRVGNAFTGEYSADGQTWETVTGTTPATIEMPETIYIGLVVSSHVAGIPCAVEFSSVSTVGNVTAEWQLADVGVAQPTGNELDTFYIAVEDSSGMKATLTNPDPYAVAAPTWQHWLIPFSDLTAAGVRINSIKTLYIGVGDKSQPSQNAAGRLYIDDIGFGHPIPTE